ncbi:MAG TPA: hypothetical protein VMC10_18075 [Stellaceae bacterium]|nr:hypothetical protein [Stellaceae bacterium]
MGERPKPVQEPAVNDLLSEEITRLLMRADHVERYQVEALVERLGVDREASKRRQKGVDP